MGGMLTITVVGVDVPKHPAAPVTVTEYEPEVRTVMRWVVSPVDHSYPSYPDAADSTTLSPSQIVAGPLVVIFGVRLVPTSTL
jgi:hypothetical protein